MRPAAAAPTVGVTKRPPDWRLRAPAKVNVLAVAVLKRSELTVAPFVTLAEARTSAFVPEVRVLPYVDRAVTRAPSVVAKPAVPTVNQPPKIPLVLLLVVERPVFAPASRRSVVPTERLMY